MRQQHHQPARLPPFGFGRRDELVRHDLRAVRKIAVLRLPQHQAQRIGHAVAELKTQHAVFAQRAIVHLELRAARRHMRQRRVNTVIFVVVIFGMAVAERASAGVLAA